MPIVVRRKPIRRTVPTLEQLETRLTPSSDVLTYHNDAGGTGQDQSETFLTPANVNSATFAKLFSTSVDGQVYAQPLYMANVNITTGANPGVHNVVFVATQNDSLYAIDANNGTVLWQDSLLHPVHGGTVTPVPSGDVGSTDLTPEIGITATPVIDAATGTIYVEAKTKEVAGDGSHYIHQLYAISINDGSYKDGGPVVVADSIGDTYVSGPTVPGTGDGSSGGVDYFDALRQQDRPGLTLANGNIYLGFASHGDQPPYHGWLLSYNATNLKLNGVLNTTPNGSDGGIWMSGDHIAVDSKGNLYFATGNGTFDTTLNAAGMPASGDYGDSYVKVAVDPTSTPTNPNINGWGLKVVDYFTPQDQATLNANDLDLGSGGVVLLPPSAGSTAHPQLMVAAGKLGRIYLIDCNNMGHYDPSTDHVVQETSNGTITGSWDTPAYYNGKLYYVGQGDVGKTFTIANAQLSPAATTQSVDSFAYPGATPSISANGSTNGIVWALDIGTNQLRAYNASGFNQELYTSAQAANERDALTGSVIKFSVPTIADGEVFIGTSDALNVYGLRNQFQVTGLPSSTTAGQTVTFTVKAEDGAGNVLTNYTGTVHFTSSDPQAVLPPDYTFNASDHGAHTFSVTFKTAGSQSLTATDTVMKSNTGSATVLVNPLTPPPPPPSPPAPPPVLATATTIVGIANAYPGLIQLETVRVHVTDSTGANVNQGVVALKVNNQTVLAPVINGYATGTIATPLLDVVLWRDLFFSHPLVANYSNNSGLFSGSAADVPEAGMLVDYFFTVLAQFQHGSGTVFRLTAFDPR